MKTKLWIAPFLLLPLGAAVASSQDTKARDASAKSDDPMMEKMKELGTPGPAHRVLDPKVGKWNWKMKMFMKPGGTPDESTGTSEVAWVMDDHYLQEETTGSFQGQPFEGLGTFGYDNLKKKYVTSFISNCGTGIGLAEGTYDPASKTFTYTGEAPDMMSGKYVRSRLVERWTDDDHAVVQSFTPGPDGKDFMCMEISYSRAK